MRLEISSATTSDRTCDRSQRIPVPEDTGKYTTIGNSVSLAPHSYHNSSATRNAWSTPVRLHILDQSRSTCSIGILGSQYHFQHSGLPHVCWKYFVSFKVHDARSESADRPKSYPDIPSQILRYSADRTGIMSFSNFPLLWLFSGRNNIFLWATGWSFASFNIFHRHVARVATLQAIVHSVLYIIMFFQSE